MINKIKKVAIKPNPYDKSTSKFWDDPYISKKMLEAHLNPNWEAASRNPDDIQNITSWIYKQKNKKNLKLLDLGCGPGLYTEKFYELGFNVTGVDLSSRSIDYAMDSAKNKTFDIRYIHKNYLELDLKETYDVITLIYCDYAALSKSDRLKLLSIVKKHLKPNGIFLFDVFTPNQYEGVIETSSWTMGSKDGFWRDHDHLVLENHYIYPNHLHCYHYIVCDEKKDVQVYRIWDQAFTKETITNELLEGGFSDVTIYSDLSGKPYQENSKLLGIKVGMMHD